MSEAQADLVLLVHGTFAAHEEGKVKWWEVGSDAWKAIEQRLPPGAKLAESKEVFAWSGANQERERYRAGVELFYRLVALEKQGRGYHLIGHSHGGSVIWHALQESVRSRVGRKSPDPRRELPNLRSWTTVGTPFLHFDESSMGRWWGAVLSKSLLVASIGLWVFLAAALWFNDVAIPVGDFFRARLGDAAEWVLGGSVAILAAIPALALYCWVSAIRLEALFVRQAVRARHHAMVEFGDRWLGIRSRQDEAINGLKGTLKLNLQLIPALRFRADRVFRYDRRVWTYRVLLKILVAPFLNRTLIPLGNNLMRGVLSKSAQGDDRPGCVVTAVSAGPVAMRDGFEYPSLPTIHDDALVAAANDSLVARAPQLVPRLRALLADYSSGVALLGDSAKDAGVAFAGNELIHTSYFANEAVLELLGHHVWAHTEQATDGESCNEGLVDWYRSSREEVKRRVSDSEIVRKNTFTLLKAGNWPALLSALSAVAVLAYAIDKVFELNVVPDFDDFQYLFIPAAVAFVFGRIGQIRAERGARFRRTASIGCNLGLAALIVLALIVLIR